VTDQNGRSARLRYTATGALAALAVAGAIAGTAALAAKPHASTSCQAVVAKGGVAQPPTSKVPGNAASSQPDSSQPFLTAVQRLVNDGTITAAEGQAVDREIQASRFDPNTLSGFTQAQLQAVDQALANTKRALAANAH